MSGCCGGCGGQKPANEAKPDEKKSADKPVQDKQVEVGVFTPSASPAK